MGLGIWGLGFGIWDLGFGAWGEASDSARSCHSLSYPHASEGADRPRVGQL